MLISRKSVEGQHLLVDTQCQLVAAMKMIVALRVFVELHGPQAGVIFVATSAGTEICRLFETVDALLEGGLAELAEHEAQHLGGAAQGLGPDVADLDLLRLALAPRLQAQGFVDGRLVHEHVRIVLVLLQRHQHGLDAFFGGGKTIVRDDLSLPGANQLHEFDAVGCRFDILVLGGRMVSLKLMQSLLKSWGLECLQKLPLQCKSLCLGELSVNSLRHVGRLNRVRLFEIGRGVRRHRSAGQGLGVVVVNLIAFRTTAW
mmetsp:Transcript_56413/g.134703  ORF Transcript_56413/g.134703 Transcript_56413/m.134703 type:complete len:259 (+) Transcript_56413:264-1040(+)